MGAAIDSTPWERERRTAVCSGPMETVRIKQNNTILAEVDPWGRVDAMPDYRPPISSEAARRDDHNQRL